MSSKRRSEVWEYFSQIKGNKVKCLYCGRVLSVANKSTNNLWRHIRSTHQFDLEPSDTSSTEISEETPDILSIVESTISDDEDSSEHSVELYKNSKSPPDMKKLIELVKSNEELYDTRNENYRNFKKRQELWENIASALNYESAAIAKKDWKNLRDGYIKALKRRSWENGKGRQNSKARKYMGLLRFVDGYSESVENGDHTSYNIQGGQRETVNAVLENVNIVNTNSKDDIVEYVNIINNHDETVPTSRSNDFGLKKEINTPVENEELKSFFLNMYETSRKFSRERQRRLRRQIFAFISDMEDDEESENTTLSLVIENDL